MKKILQLILVIGLISVSQKAHATNNDTLYVNPNLFDSITVIHFDINATDTVSLVVYNAGGQSIKTYFNKTILPSGSFALTFNGDTLSNGIYFAHLTINSVSHNAKFIKTQSIVGIDEYDKNKTDFLMYPNPTSSNIEIPFDGIKTLIVTDINGKILLNSIFESKSCSLLELPAGCYVVTILSEQKKIVATQKIIKL